MPNTLLFKKENCVTKLQEKLSVFSSEAAIAFHFQEGLREIAFWGMRYFLKILQDNQIFSNTTSIYHADDIKKQLQLLPYYWQQLNELLKVLVGHKLIVLSAQDTYRCQQQKITLEQLLLDKETLLVNYPELNVNINFLYTLLENYLLILSGKEIFLNKLFPNGGFDIVVDLYKNNPEVSYYNRLTANVIACFIEHYTLLGEASFINILEIGAGVGSTSQQLLSLLNNKVGRQYHYTDISSAFLAYGRYQFKQYSDFLSFSKFDINRAPEAQGFQQNYYDVILATNVIHNAASITKTLTDINSLLRPGGILVLNEGIAKSDYSTLVYGLSQGWWSFTDPEWRLPGTPLINLLGWQKLFLTMPFNFNISINQTLNISETMHQDVIVAVKNQEN